MDEKVLLKVDGMDCASCATSISKTLNRQGLQNVHVDFITGEVTFSKPETGTNKAIESINNLGYHVRPPAVEASHQVDREHHDHAGSVERKFYISLIFSIPLLLHMFLDVPILQNPYFQLALCLPVFVIGVMHFGKSAFYSIRYGSPNMDVLIFTGSTAAFIYSIVGMIRFDGTDRVHHFLFFETAATIITLVLLGNLIEQRSVRRTTSAIAELGKLQPKTAKRIDGNGEPVECPIDDLQPGDEVLVNSGDLIPVDGEVTGGQAAVNESMLSGESLPVYKNPGERVTGGTVVDDGNLRIKALRTGKDTTLSGIIEMVKNAQRSKPDIQRLGDRISAIFVPVVMGIAILTFIISYFVADISMADSLMASIAVLVISCPCAMGLATPTAVMVGLGRAALNKILIRGGATVETLAGIKTIVFDKTGTLTTGNFKILKVEALGEDENRIREILFALEKHSSHPIARSLQKELSGYNSTIAWKEIKEDKGIGINATDGEGNLYSAGSFQMVKHFHSDLSHDVYVLKNNKLIATVDLEDEIKPGTKEVVSHLKEMGLHVIMLSGDRKKNCMRVAEATGIDEVQSEMMPAEKLSVLEELVKKNPTAMFGDGINDAPALTKASVGISISSATEAAIQSAQVILLDKTDLHILVKAIRISRRTYSTIKQNLFWAFCYNVVAIPIAAMGLLSPMIGAMSMAFSDVIVIGNSLRLKTRKIS